MNDKVLVLSLAVERGDAYDITLETNIIAVFKGIPNEIEVFDVGI